MHVEQSFGVMIALEGILWRLLRFCWLKNAQVAGISMCLLLFCADYSENFPVNMMFKCDYGDSQQYTTAQLQKNGRLPGRNNTWQKSTVREHLVRLVDETGISRLILP